MLRQSRRFRAHFVTVLALLSGLLFFGITPANAADLSNASISGTIAVPGGIDKTNLSVSIRSSTSYYRGQLNEDGTYQVSGLPAGTYKVQVNGYLTGALDQWYGGSSEATAAPVTVAAGQSVSNINLTLVKGASIVGKITAPSGVAISSVSVSARTDAWSSTGQSQVNSDGTYKILGLPAGVYRVQFSGSGSGALDQWNGGAASFDAATPLTLTAGQDLMGINAVLIKGASVSGKISAPAGTDLSRIAVTVSGAERWSYVGYGYANATGDYTIKGLPAGNYKVQFATYGGVLLDQWYKDSGSFESATPITVAPGQDISAINAAMLKGASISGKVTVPAGVNLPSISVSVQSADRVTTRLAQVGADGNYTVSGLPAGKYKVQFNSQNTGALDQWFKGASSFETATEVPVAAQQSVTGIDAILVKGASVSGVVTAPAGVDRSKMTVTANPVNNPGLAMKYAPVTPDGTYKVSGLPPGKYTISFSGYGSGALDQWYPNAATSDAATVLDLGAGQDFTGANATLVKGASVSGNITAPAGTNLSALYVSVIRTDVQRPSSNYGYAQSDGSYEILGLPAGSYRVEFYAVNTGLLSQTGTSAKSITLAAGQDLTGINTTMAKGASISGKISAPSGVDVSRIGVLATLVDGVTYAASSNTAVDGAYSIKGLPAGNYKIRFQGQGSGALDEWFDNVTTSAAAAPITVAAGQDRTGVEATLLLGGTITGRIIAPAGVTLSAGSTYASVVQATDGSFVAGTEGYVWIGTDGRYNLRGLPAGSYKVRFTSYGTGAVESWYGGTGTLASATAITIAAGQTVTALDTTLIMGATVSGKITAPVGTVFSTTGVIAYPNGSTNGQQYYGTVGTTGNYSISGLPAGTYKLKFDGGGSGAADTWYGGSSLSTAASVTVATGQTRAGADITATAGATLSGIVTGLDSTSGYPLQVLDSAGQVVKNGYTGPTGTFSVVGLAAGSYKVAFNRSSGYSQEEAQYYLNKPESAGPGQAQSIAVSTGQSVGNINATLVQGGTISGTATDQSGRPVAGARVQAYTVNGSLITRSGLTDAEGKYTVPGLSTGQYVVKLTGNATTPGDLYSGNAATEATATPVSVTAGKPTALNFAYATAALTTSVPTISGTAKVGSTLTAVPGTWGPTPVTFAYQWKANGVIILGATASTYKPVASNAGKTLTVTVTGTKTGYTTAAKTSAATTSVAVGTLTAPTPTITGNANFGSVLTAVTGTWGPAPVSLAYQWKANGTAITGATAGTYTPVAADLGKSLTVTVTGTKTGYATAAKTSVATASVGAGILTAPVPTITGTAKAGSTLTAAPGAWSPAPVTLAYQWKANGIAIAGATTSTYVPITADLGKTVTVAVTGTKAGYTTATATSVSTPTVMAVNPVLTAPVPTVTGTPKVGATLTAAPGTWGPAPVTLSYQWKADGVSLTGATASTYKPVAANVGKTLTVTVTGTKAGYTNAAKSSAPTAGIAVGTLTAPTPTISGSVNVGSVLTAAAGSWGPAPVTLAYQWKASGAAISGATTSTYTPVPADLGKSLTVTVTGTKAGYTTAAKTSVATAAVAPGILTGPVPTITGTAKAGSTLTAVAGTWGPAPVTLTYQWKANGVVITGATAATYKPVAANVGKAITVTVTGTKTSFTTAAQTSAATASVAAGTLTAPVPTITGTAKVGSILTAVPGTWGPAPVTLAYQWKANGIVISGATASTFTPVAEHIGKTLTVTVTGTKTGYTTAAKTSAATAGVL